MFWQYVFELNGAHSITDNFFSYSSRGRIESSLQQKSEILEGDDWTGIADAPVGSYLAYYAVVYYRDSYFYFGVYDGQ